MKILLLSAYDAESHRRWREGLVACFPYNEWHILTLPPRFFNWRIRGNPLSWGWSQMDVLTRAYDLVIATSMVDLCTLRGLIPSLASVPAILYCHENQFAYPLTENQKHTVEPQMVTLYSALCADRVLFNSHYNCETFLQGVDTLLKRLPDHVPAGIVDHLQDKAQVLPVPIEQHCYQAPQRVAGGALQILWNHRWEYDKGPDNLLAAVRLLPAEQAFTFHIVGQQFRHSPKSLEALRELLHVRGWLGRWGFIESIADYQALLCSCHIVLSTALHDFQGLAVLEAVAAGCVPIVPDRMAYRELFASAYRYPSAYDPQHGGAVGDAEPRACASLLSACASQWSRGLLLSAPDVKDLSWSNLKQEYSRLLESTAK